MIESKLKKNDESSKMKKCVVEVDDSEDSDLSESEDDDDDDSVTTENVCNAVLQFDGNSSTITGAVTVVDTNTTTGVSTVDDRTRTEEDDNNKCNMSDNEW